MGDSTPVFSLIGTGGSDALSVTTATIPSVNIGAGDVFAAIVCNNNRDVSSITIGGSANLVRLTDASDGTSRMQIWGVSGYAGGTGVDIVATLIGGATFTAFIAMGVENSPADAESAEFTDANVGGAISITNTNGRRLAVHAAANNSSTMTLTGVTGQWSHNPLTYNIAIGYTFPATADNPVTATASPGALVSAGAVLSP